ncbi:exodeoxyribonuclease III [Flaviflagellibacter deserti]|uniref:Exodeoxyribonuclease III n=1 Tax=Flaviflagellibacter deserti TaxID=2267266 RepID=A0ABV9YZW1_9HYPH
MRIATWNINSVRLRQENVLRWLKEAEPDVLCLQEIKCQNEQFPREAFEDAGYNSAVHGQKSWNGVAILSRHPIDERHVNLPGDSADEQSRYIEAEISTEDGIMRVASIYLPNGNPVDTAKYPYKLAWMERLRQHVAARLLLEEPLILAGDYNVIPAAEDVHNPAAWVEDALFKIETRQAFDALLNLGLTEALRATTDESGLYTFWDYQAGAWQRNAGLRIDHLLLSPQAADRLRGVRIDKYVRAWDKPSDHVPVIGDFAIEPR